MLKSQKQTKVYQLFTILVGALLMGFLWRVRGTHGWGSSWGLLNAGFIFTMFVVLFKGERKKLNFGWLALTSLSFMLTVPAWGTLLKQTTGVLFMAEDLTNIVQFNSAYANDVYCSVPSGIYIMLTLGFGLASLFGIMLGRAYSDKAWKLRDYIILFAVFFAADLIAKATISHFILNLLQPEAAEVFMTGLKGYMLELVPEEHLQAVMDTLSTKNLEGIGFDELKALVTQTLPAEAAEAFEKAVTKKSIDGANAWQVYLQHFDDVSWAKKVTGGRNYFQSVEMISFAIKAVACLITTRFIIKDKRAANTGFIVCGAFSFAITAANLFFFFENGGYHMLHDNYFGGLSDRIYAWSCWEYFTGFIAGGIITAHLMGLKEKDDVEDIAFTKVPSLVNKILTFILSFGFLIGVSIVRPVLERFDESKNQVLYVVISVVFAVILIAILASRWGIAGEKAGMTRICANLLPLFTILIFISYVWLCSPSYNNFSGLGFIHNLMCLVSVPTVITWSLAKREELITNNK